MTRTRLFVLGDWITPVYDSDTSDMHPVDFLLYGPHTELSVVIDYGADRRQRWSGIWSQTSRRKYLEHDMFGQLEKLLTWPEIPAQVTAPSYEEQRRSLRYQPIGQALAPILRDANLTITVNNNTTMHRDGR